MPKRKTALPARPRVSTRDVALLIARTTSHTRKMLKAAEVDCLWINGNAAWLASDVQALLDKFQAEGAPRDTSKARAARADKRGAK